MTDHYLEQLRHQLAQTRAELRRAEDELAVHRQRVSRETRLRLAWQSARRRAAAADALLATFESNQRWYSTWPSGLEFPAWNFEHLGAAFGEAAKPWWAVRAEENRQRDLVHQRLDGQLPVATEPMTVPSEEQMRALVRQAFDATYPCEHRDPKRLGTRPGDLALVCACGAEVFPGPFKKPEPRP